MSLSFLSRHSSELQGVPLPLELSLPETNLSHFGQNPHVGKLRIGIVPLSSDFLNDDREYRLSRLENLSFLISCSSISSLSTLNFSGFQ